MTQYGVPRTDGGSSFPCTRTLVSSSDQSAAAANASPAPTSGQRIVVDDIHVSVDTAMRVDFKEETSGTVLWSTFLPANGSDHLVCRGKLKLDTVDKKLQVQTSAAGEIRVTTITHSEP